MADVLAVIMAGFLGVANGLILSATFGLLLMAEGLELRPNFVPIRKLRLILSLRLLLWLIAEAVPPREGAVYELLLTSGTMLRVWLVAES